MQAVWSGSPYLSWVYYSELMAELQFAEVKRKINSGSTNLELSQLLEEYDKFFSLEISGYNRLLERFEKQTIGGINNEDA